MTKNHLPFTPLAKYIYIRTHQENREQAKGQAPRYHHHHDHQFSHEYLDGKEMEQTRAKEYKLEGQKVTGRCVVNDDVVYVMTICESFVKVQHTWDLKMRTLIYSTSFWVHTHPRF